MLHPCNSDGWFMEKLYSSVPANLSIKAKSGLAFLRRSTFTFSVYVIASSQARAWRCCKTATQAEAAAARNQSFNLLDQGPEQLGNAGLPRACCRWCCAVKLAVSLQACEWSHWLLTYHPRPALGYGQDSVAGFQTSTQRDWSVEALLPHQPGEQPVDYMLLSQIKEVLYARNPEFLSPSCAVSCPPISWWFSLHQAVLKRQSCARNVFGVLYVTQLDPGGRSRRSRQLGVTQSQVDLLHSTKVSYLGALLLHCLQNPHGSLSD